MHCDEKKDYRSPHITHLQISQKDIVTASHWTPTIDSNQGEWDSAEFTHATNQDL